MTEIRRKAQFAELKSLSVLYVEDNPEIREAIKAGLHVVGIYDGFQHLIEGRPDMASLLSLPDVSPVQLLTPGTPVVLA